MSSNFYKLKMYLSERMNHTITCTACILYAYCRYISRYMHNKTVTMDNGLIDVKFMDALKNELMNGIIDALVIEITSRKID